MPTDEEKGRATRCRVGFLYLSAFVLCLAYPFYLSRIFPGWEQRGQFGDSYGSLGAIASALALIALVHAIVLQRKDLRIQAQVLESQKEELKLTRIEIEGQKKEMAGQREQLEKQSQIIEDQSFASYCFEMMGQFRNAQKNLYNPIRGIDLTNMQTTLKKAWTASSGYGEADKLPRVQRVYNDVYPLISRSLEPYLLILQDLFSLLSSGPPARVPALAATIRASLCQRELVMIFYHLLAAPTADFDRLLSLAQEYDLFRYLDNRCLLFARHRELFPEPE